jgi:signal transduction histidine kinase
MQVSSASHRPRGGCRTLSWAAGIAPGLAGCGADAGAGAGAGPWIFGSLALVMVAAAAYAAGNLAARGRHEAAQRATRQDQRLLAHLVDGWLWQTDATHRLTVLEPAEGAPDADAPAARGKALWDAFDTPALRTLLESSKAITDLPVSGHGRTWRLRALPRYDDLGRFAGHTGQLREDAGADRETERAALAALADGIDAPVLIGRLQRGDGVLWHANDAAWQRLRAAGVEPAPDVSWRSALDALPPALRDALACLRPGAAAVHDGWRMQRIAARDAEDGVGELVLLMAPRPGGDGADEDRGGEALGVTVSHDLRAPVRVVDGFTRILKEDYGRLLDRVGNDHLDRVLAAAARMNHMIDALIALSRLATQPLVRQPVNLSQMAQFVVDDLRRASPERVAEFAVQPGLQVVGDPTLLRLVLENLLGNAWKYTSKTARAQIVLESEPHDGRRAFVVRDNGAGFDMRSVDRLFGLFQRLHSATDFPGTGVGLASVKRIVQRHGGTVWADAEPGRGAAFYFTLRE